MVKVLNTEMFDKSLTNVVDKVIELCSYSKNNLCISATGAHGLVTAIESESFKHVLDHFYINLPDGMPGVWIGKLKGAKEMARCYGPDYFGDLIYASRNKNIRHYFCGGNEGVANELKNICAVKYNNENIVGTFSPPFREMTEKEFELLASQINSLNTNIVWIGLSTPKQEVFAFRLSKYTNVHFICTVGAAFDFHTGKVVQAPQIIQSIGMEWFFRLLMEPKRLLKRYLEIVPKFIYYNIMELLQFLTNTIRREDNV